MDTISRLTGIFCEKDTNFAVTECNNVFLKYAHLQSYDQAIGKTDYDFIWADNADTYRNHELDALSGNNYSIVIPQKLSLKHKKTDNSLLFLHTKLQKTDSNGKIIGISVRAIEIINPDLATLTNLLARQSPSGKNIFYMGKQNNMPKLSKRQSEILFYLSMGKTNKAIAKILDLSVRTIEYYIEIIKNKHQCRTRWELISLAIEQGHAQTIPSSEPIHTLIKKINTT